jgi:uncharacterized membrane protein
MSDLAQTPPLVCPACQGVNPPDAVFCGNAHCRKALGNFKYAPEEIAATTTALERLADWVTRFTGRPHFVTVHVLWFALWIVLNSGLIMAASVFDAYPYSLLGIILSIEAILITSFLLISQNRQNVHADKRAELEYEVNVRSYRKLLELHVRLEQLNARLERIERRGGGGNGPDSAP